MPENMSCAKLQLSITYIKATAITNLCHPAPQFTTTNAEILPQRYLVSKLSLLNLIASETAISIKVQTMMRVGFSKLLMPVHRQLSMRFRSPFYSTFSTSIQNSLSRA